MDAGPAVERIDLKSAVVGEHQLARATAAVFDGLDHRVLFHGRAALDRGRQHRFLRQQLKIDLGFASLDQRLEIAQLAQIGGREIDVLFQAVSFTIS